MCQHLICFYLVQAHYLVSHLIWMTFDECFGFVWSLVPQFFFQTFHKHIPHFYRLCSRGDNMFGSMRVSVCLSVGALLFEPFDL